VISWLIIVYHKTFNVMWLLKSNLRTLFRTQSHANEPSELLLRVLSVVQSTSKWDVSEAQSLPETNEAPSREFVLDSVISSAYHRHCSIGKNPSSSSSRTRSDSQNLHTSLSRALTLDQSMRCPRSVSQIHTSASVWNLNPLPHLLGSPVIPENLASVPTCLLTWAGTQKWSLCLGLCLRVEDTAEWRRMRM
jgi:hypothetical protein